MSALPISARCYIGDNDLIILKWLYFIGLYAWLLHFWNDGGEGVLLLKKRWCCDNSKKCYKSTAFFAEMQENCDFI